MTIFSSGYLNSTFNSTASNKRNLQRRSGAMGEKSTRRVVFGLKGP
jgi:hypothetical protein